jgi:hypothetical protein
VPLQVLAQGNTQSPPSNQASSDVADNNSKDLTNAPQTAPPSTRQASPAQSSSHEEPVNSNDEQPNNAGNGDDDAQTTSAPENTETGSPKGDDTEPSPANVESTEHEQSAVDEGGVANG